MRGALRAMVWIVGGACLCLLVAYGLLLALNARDEAPSPQAAALGQVAARQPAVAEADNGFIYLLGMAGEGGSPMALGRLRAQAMAAGGSAPARDVLDRPYRKQRSADVMALSRACGEDQRKCAGALAAPANEPVARHWLASEAWLLARYHELIALPGWRETWTGLSQQIPNYAPAMDGQRLLLLQAWLAARAGDRATGVRLLDEDMRFWRVMLRDTDTLIGKMVATAALNRNFAMGSLALSESGPARDGTVPPAWQVPFDEDERAMARALAGELRYSRQALAELLAAEARAPAEPEQPAGRRLLDHLGRQLFQPQATLNLAAARLQALALASQVDYPALPGAVASADVAPHATPWQWLFNPTGRVLMKQADGMYAGYALRVADLEGMRRAALEAARLRAAGVAGDDVAAHLAAADALRDPYTGAPLAWAGEAIGFSGHDPRRNLQLIVY